MCEHLLMASREMLKDILKMCIEIVFFGSLTPMGLHNAYRSRIHLFLISSFLIKHFEGVTII